MDELEQFSKHLTSLRQTDWERLFALLPDIENTEKFGEIKAGELIDENTLNFPYWIPAEIVDKTFRIINELKITPVFDWTRWKEGSTILNDINFDYSKADTLILCKLITTIIRTDRFSDGFFISCFESGIMAKIIKALKSNIQSARKT